MRSKRSLSEDSKKNNRHWFLLKTKHNQEKRASRELERQDIEVFFPYHKLERLKKGVIKIEEEPLFPGYIFVSLCLEATNWTSVRSTRGVTSYVKFGGKPAVVDDNIIIDLKNLILSSPKPYLKPGQKVGVFDGSLRGLEAVFMEPDGPSRSIIMLSFMQQNQKLSIDNKYLETI
tara:strand:- start:152 stop:676 length:525 start_codon:yes stop_codon:yes gene_type:complete